MSKLRATRSVVSGDPPPLHASRCRRKSINNDWHSPVTMTSTISTTEQQSNAQLRRLQRACHRWSTPITNVKTLRMNDRHLQAAPRPQNKAKHSLCSWEDAYRMISDSSEYFDRSISMAYRPPTSQTEICQKRDKGRID